MPSSTPFGGHSWCVFHCFYGHTLALLHHTDFLFNISPFCHSRSPPRLTTSQPSHALINPVRTSLMVCISLILSAQIRIIPLHSFLIQYFDFSHSRSPPHLITLHYDLPLSMPFGYHSWYVIPPPYLLIFVLFHHADFLFNIPPFSHFRSHPASQLHNRKAPLLTPFGPDSG